MKPYYYWLIGIALFILAFLFALNGRYKGIQALKGEVILDSWTGAVHVPGDLRSK